MAVPTPYLRYESAEIFFTKIKTWETKKPLYKDDIKESSV